MAAPAPAPKVRDLVFSLDGSGSIDSSDWQLQKDGYTAALADQVAFPRNGSVSVAVSQWSGAGQVKTEVATRVLASQADVDAVVTGIQAAQQFAGSTDPVTGLDAATAILAANGRANSGWNVCMSTDGTKNDGSGSLDASTAAARNAGVDRYSVVGIEDSGNRQELESYYRPQVFGGGSFTLARNTVEFANLIIGACVNDPVELKGLEVTQGVQNWKNSVPLVAARSTVVRAFVQVPAGAPAQRVSARLIGRRGGNELPGSPLPATNAGGSVLASPDVVSRREVLDDSLVFQLPASWRTGTVELQLDGAGTPITCQEAADPTPSDCKATVDFQAGANAKVKVIGIPVTGGGTTTLPSVAALTETGERIGAALPAAKSSIIVKDRLFTSIAGPDPKLTTVNNVLTAQRYLDLCFSVFGCNTIYYGQLSGSGTDGGLAADIPSDVASGWDHDLTARNSTGWFRNVAAHEVGHTLGLNHSVRGPVVGSTKRGPCREVAASSAPDFPYFGSVSGSDRSLLGPAGAGTDDQIWGLDTRFARGDSNHLAVIAPTGPRATFDLMGYCYIAAPQQGWASDHTWKLAMQGLTDRFGAKITAAQTTAAASTTGTHLLFTGVIDAGTDAATIDSPTLLDGQIPTPPSGDYELRLIGSAGETLATVPFQPQSDSGLPGDPAGGPTESNPTFTVPVLRPSKAVAKVQIWHKSVKVGERAASPGVPTVTITDPAAGSTQTGSDVTVTWKGADPDGDKLRYAVRYSADGGTTWQTLAVDFDGTSIAVPRSALPGSSDAVVEIQATDGLNIGTGTSGQFTVKDSGPAVTLSAPQDGETFYSGVQQVLLEADAVDEADDDVSASITWASDVDGQIFAGPSGSIGADQLSEGKHTLTATATDSKGNTGTATVKIMVYRVAPPPPPPVTGPVVPMCDGRPATIVGDGKHLTIHGTTGDDVILGSGAGELIRSRGGNDTICAGGGNDRISADGGNDVVFGGDGDDEITGADGDDALHGDAGKDVVTGGDGADQLWGGDDADVISAGAGDDVVNADGGDDLVTGGSGADEIHGGAGADVLSGGDQNDHLFGDDGDDRMAGGNGDDELVGGPGTDVLNGGAGNNILTQ